MPSRQQPNRKVHRSRPQLPQQLRLALCLSGVLVRSRCPVGDSSRERYSYETELAVGHVGIAVLVSDVGLGEGARPGPPWSRDVAHEPALQF